MFWRKLVFMFIPLMCFQKCLCNYQLRRIDSNCSLKQIVAYSNSESIIFLIDAGAISHPPSGIVAYSTNPYAVANVNCTTFNNNNSLALRNSVSIDHVNQSYGFILHRLCVYEDGQNIATASESDIQCRSYLGSNLNWTSEGFDHSPSNDAISFVFSAENSLDSHDKFLSGGFIKLKFSVYASDRTADLLYFGSVGPLNLVVELEFNRLELKDNSSRVAPILIIFSNHSLGDDEDFKQKIAYPINGSAGPLGKLESNFLIMSDWSKFSTWPHGYVHFPPAYRLKKSTTSQYARVGIRRPFNKSDVNPHSIQHSLPYALYGDRFEQIHQGPHADHVGTRLQVIDLGNAGQTFELFDLHSWTMVWGLGDPALIDEAFHFTTSGFLIGIFVGTLIISVGLGSYFAIKRCCLNRYRNIAEANIASSISSVTQNPDVIAEPYVQDKLTFEPIRSSSNYSHPKSSDRNFERQPLLYGPIPPPPPYNTLP